MNRRRPSRKARRREASGDPYNTRLEIEESMSFVPKQSSRNGAIIFGLAVFIVVGAVVLLVFWAATAEIGLVAIIVAIIVALIVTASSHIALSWEKVVILRFGKVVRLAGPGLYFTIPIVEYGTICIDQRVVATPFYAEKTLTADLVPVTVDAVLYWMVWDVEKACTEVEDFYSAVLLLAQTAMREAVGRSTAAETAIRRDELDAEIKEEIEKEVSNWGIDILSVKVRDIVIPDELQKIMVLEAQADREKNARMTVAAAETDLAEMLSDAARIYGDPDAAFKLRAMLMQYDTVKVSQSSVVTIPSTTSSGFLDASSMTAAASATAAAESSASASGEQG